MSFCPGCGKSAGGAPLAASGGRVARHARLLGILWIALSICRLLPGLAIWGFFRHGMPFVPWGLHGLLGAILPAVGVMLFASGVIGIVAGWGILDRHSWARGLAIVLAFLNLLDMPFGTALGIYTLWVLMPAESDREFHAECRRA